MIVVRLLSLVIFSACINSHVDAMFAIGSRIGRQRAKRVCSGKTQKDRCRFGQIAFAVGAVATVMGGLALWLEARDIEDSCDQINASCQKIHVACLEANMVLEENSATQTAFATYYLDEKKDLQGFIEHVIELGKNPNHFVTESGKTALMLACQKGDFMLVEKLFEYSDIDVNGNDNYGRSVLSYAIKSGEKNIVSFLLEIENINVHDTSVQAALFYNNNPEIRDEFGHYEYKQILKSIAKFAIKQTTQ